MAIDAWLGLWSVSSCIALCIATALSLGFAELLSSRIHPDTTLFSLKDSVHSKMVRGALWSMELPNFWIWYDGAAIRDVLRAQTDTHIEFILVTVFHASWGTAVVGMTVLTISMTLAVRAFTFDSRFARRWFGPLVCLAAFVADLLEDILLIVIALGFPHTDYPVLAWLCSWCSFVKFASWFVILCWWLTMAFVIAVRPPALGRRAKVFFR